MKQWLESKQATLLRLKYPEEVLQEYQNYLLNEPDCFPDWEEDEFEDGPMDFESWQELWQDQVDFEQSDEFNNELQRLAEKD
jgi:hypothetical protein